MNFHEKLYVDEIILYYGVRFKSLDKYYTSGTSFKSKDTHFTMHKIHRSLYLIFPKGSVKTPSFYVVIFFLVFFMNPAF